MRILKLALIIAMISVVCSQSDAEQSRGYIKAYPVKQKLFKVAKIDSTARVYLVYASRNDSLFKIVSDRVRQRSCTRIQVGACYPFQLNTGLGIVDDYMIKSWNGISLDEESHHNLYTAYNLIGLCLK